jgi:uncharacterized damage-inducible protein DinB
MAENRDALLEHYRRMRAELLGAIDGLTDAEATERTLDGWSVKDHLAHLALWDELRASEVARISAGHESAWRMHGQDAVYSSLGYDLRRDLSYEQVRWELASTHERLLDAIRSATERGLDPSRYGEAGLRSTHEAVHTHWITRWRAARGG